MNTSMAGRKPAMNAAQIWNMSFGFLGIQIGFELQNGNVSRIFQTLGAEVNELAILWIAAPMTGLIIQPIIGHMSDKTWSAFGRRRPYFLVGAILATLALFIMPNSPTLWVAAGMLWIMDASLNITMEPFRAFVGDNLPDRQRTKGYAMQSFFIGVGAVIAGALPWVMTNWMGLSNTAPAGEIPETVQWAFYIGGAALLVAVMWTVFSTKEYSPEQIAAFEKARNEALGIVDKAAETVKRTAAQFFSGGAVWVVIGAVFAAFVAYGRAQPDWIPIGQELYILAGLIASFGVIQIIAGMLRQSDMDQNGFMEVVNDLFAMPKTMRQLAVVQFFSWFAMFALWIYGTPAVTDYHFASPDPTTQGYQDGADWWSLMGSVRNGLAAAAALAFVVIASKVDRRKLHSINLFVGAIGFSLMIFVRDPAVLWLSQIGLGIAWASIVSLPYAILAGSVPARKMGIYMGIFNIFIVVPQLIAATLLGFLLTVFFEGAPIYAMAIGGVSFVLAAIATLFVTDATSAVREMQERLAEPQ
ncbi:MFS transporter [Erythrobacter sp. THAF29]|uniref:MFS transporter n=1 Tax=Erythrobacter sp. THAF29 TaxID=2587851 RepID=UPI0012A8623C|nr:MFS transporter [Erythrobacter sp. THAF29]QFT77336.1 Major Facilitator Superfamily protein [Erythrobacter sp. THAF29]